MMGNFVVIKHCNHHFDQVPPDQATEWINHMCKISNGIIEIALSDPAKDRFCTTWAVYSHVSYDTRNLFGIEDDENAIFTWNAILSCVKSDEDAVKSWYKNLSISVCSALQFLL